LPRPDIGLETHVRDITNLIEYEDLRNVILVGNSSPGWQLRTIASSHLPYITHPSELAVLLLGVVG